MRPLPMPKNTKKSHTMGGIDRHDTTIPVDVSRSTPLADRRIAQSGNPNTAPRTNDASVSAIVHGTPFKIAARFRVDRDVTAPIPHRAGRAQLRHPVLHCTDSLTYRYSSAQFELAARETS